PREGHISFAIEKTGSDVLISVRDNGIGIPEWQKSKIFSKFYRASNAAAKDPNGFGLGLYIVKAVVDALGGKISFDSVENEGSTFRVTLPVAVIPDTAATPQVQAGA